MTCSPTLPCLTHPVWLLLLAATTAACGDTPARALPESEQIAQELTDTSLRLIPDPSAGESSPILIGRLGDATLIGGKIAVLDLLPPHIKVFDTTGVSSVSFLENGEGPGQMRMPVALASWDDSTLVVAGVSGRLAMWSIDGLLIREGPGVPGLPVMGMARCGDRLILYGPSVDSSGTTAQREWLRTIDSDLTAVGSTALHESVEPGEVHGVGGKVYGIAVSGDSLLTIRHQFGPSPGVIQFTCSDLAQQQRLFDLPQSLRMPSPPPGGGPVAPPRSTGPRPAGMVTFGNAIVLADLLVSANGEDPDSTRFTVITNDGIDSIDVGGRHQLLGGSANAALVLEGGPHQAVRVVPNRRR